MFHETFVMPDGVYEIIAAIAGATISGWILLRSHHSKVQEEIRLHKEIDVFERKKIVYQNVLNNVTEILDYVTLFGKKTNWRIARQTYNDLILTGSKSIIDAYNDFLKNYDGNNPKTDEKVKKILFEIRKDLYKEDLKITDIKFMVPGSRTMKSLELIGKHRSTLEEQGFDSLDSLSQMNVDDIKSKTAIAVEDLQKIKDICQEEKQFSEELKNSLKND